MAGYFSAIICPLIRRLGRRVPSRECQIQVLHFFSLICSQPRELIGLSKNLRYSPIHILNNDVLLNIFHLYRLADPDEYDDGTGMAIAWPRQQ
jgi:hypothetical protein